MIEQGFDRNQSRAIKIKRLAEDPASIRAVCCEWAEERRKLSRPGRLRSWG